MKPDKWSFFMLALFCRKTKMRNIAGGILACAALCSQQLHATMILPITRPNGNPVVELTPRGRSATGILNLKVGGDLYNVSFSGRGTLDFQTPGTVFDSNVKALPFFVQIALALTFSPAEFVRAPPLGNVLAFWVLYVDPFAGTNFLAGIRTEPSSNPPPGFEFPPGVTHLWNTNPGITFTTAGGNPALNRELKVVAVITPVAPATSVPEPASFTLFVLAIGALGFQRRKAA